MNTLKNKVALVTGASRGIGAAVAKQLAGQGARVIVNYAGSQQETEETVQAIHNADGEAIAIRADVNKVDEVAAMLDAAIAQYGHRSQLFP